MMLYFTLLITANVRMCVRARVRACARVRVRARTRVEETSRSITNNFWTILSFSWWKTSGAN